MRRASPLALLFLLLSSCMVRPVYVDPTTVPGTIRPRFGQPRGMQLCREVRRVRCDREHCGGAATDLVTLNCASGPITRCEIGKGGC